VAVNVSATARLIYAATRNDAVAVAAIRAEYTALALSIATDPDAAFELTSSTVNGQTFSGKRTTTNSERLALLSEIVWSYENGQALPRSTRILF
jgi:hypothetical protein